MIRKIKSSIPGYLFILPFLIFFITFKVYPIFKAIYLSFFDLEFEKGNWVGIQNYIQLFKDSLFLQAFLNTFSFVLIVVPVSLIISFTLALMIFKKSDRLQNFFRAAFYIPIVISGVIISVIWLWILHPILGLANYVLEIFKIEPVFWLGDKSTALPVLAMVVLTWFIGGNIIIFLASLGSIPKTYYEVADIDGATYLRKVFSITLPLLKPTSLYLLITSTIGALQIFEVVRLMTGGGPGNATTTVMYMIYKTAFFYGRFGLASAMGVILAVVAVIIAVVQFKFLSTDVEY
jgi:multiple sugar transport system permease protein